MFESLGEMYDGYMHQKAFDEGFDDGQKQQGIDELQASYDEGFFLGHSPDDDND